MIRGGEGCRVQLGQIREASAARPSHTPDVSSLGCIRRVPTLLAFLKLHPEFRSCRYHEAGPPLPNPAVRLLRAPTPVRLAFPTRRAGCYRLPPSDPSRLRPG